MDGERQRSEKLRRDYGECIEARKQTEMQLTELTSEFQRFHMQIEEVRRKDQEELQRMTLFIKDLKFQLEDVSLQLDNKRDEAMQYERELSGCRTSIERLG